METQHIRFLLDFLHRGCFGVTVAVVVAVLVVGQHTAAEAAQPLGGGAAVVAVADQTDGLAHQLHAPIFLAVPDGLPYLAVGFVEVIKKHEQHPDGMLGHGVAVARSGVKQADAQPFGSFGVD